MRFILFRGSSLYGSVDRMLDSLAVALTAQGDAAPIIDATAPDYIIRLQQAITDGPVDAFLGFSGIGLDQRAEGNLYNALEKPLVSIYLDPLLLYWNQVATPIRRRLIFTTAPGDLDYWRGKLGVPIPLKHLPHAATALPAGRAPVPWAARDIELLHAGTAPANPAALRAAWTEHGPKVEGRLNAMLDAHDADPFAPLPDIIARVGHPVTALAAPQSLYPYFQTLDLYLRARVRWRMILALLDRPLTLVGPGWEAVVAAADGPVRARLLGQKSAAEVADLTARTRLVVNSCTPYHGSHERLFQAMAAGAVAFSSATAWLGVTAPVGVLAQARPDLGDVPALADSLLQDPAKAQAMAEAGRAWFEGAHTWVHRAATIREAVAAL
ncbi:MAG TPA: glycosyltransferase [Aliidongia sp.]|uniref:glycosyltransferase n=1 Tax=Aliidongia sp. TaxID=1914230 RepID=UPI002DDD258F|nr:glycosyltransferase [Aliidongia sp.]HEV2673692.1 glycosyltransferase [Aliidongia sp.]